MPRITNPIEATGEQVAANIKRLRGSMQYKELSERLSAIGRPMTPVAIRDAENGKRRVDVDDLMAFAIVFDVSPLTLLMPETGSRHIKAGITGRKGTLGSNVVWLWARGDEPLELSERKTEADRQIAEYQTKAVPVIDEREGVTGNDLAPVPLEDLLENMNRHGVNVESDSSMLMRELLRTRAELRESQGLKD